MSASTVAETDFAAIYLGREAQGVKLIGPCCLEPNRRTIPSEKSTFNIFTR